jgi:hypothetical protein
MTDELRRFAHGLTAFAFLAALLIPMGQVSDASADAAAEMPISSVPQQLLNNFSVLRTPPEVVPLRLAEGIATINEQPPPTGGHGFNAALGQEITIPGKHAPLWAIPGRDRLTLWDVSKKPALWGGSATIVNAVRKGVAFSTPVPHAPHLVEVKGLVPDGITGVKLSRSAVAQVHDNAFTLRVDQKKLWQSRSWIFIRRR